jgi:hypothetical protein
VPAATPDVTINGWLDPLSTPPIASIALVDFADFLKSRKIVDKHGVNHRIRCRRSAAQAFQIFEITRCARAPAVI